MNIDQDDCDDTTKGAIGCVARKLRLSHSLNFLFFLTAVGVERGF
jgi:hypothetical protein